VTLAITITAFPVVAVEGFSSSIFSRDRCISFARHRITLSVLLAKHCKKIFDDGLRLDGRF
jgi:hypothetical protein